MKKTNIIFCRFVTGPIVWPVWFFQQNVRECVLLLLRAAVLHGAWLVVLSCVCRRCLYRPEPARATVTTVFVPTLY